MATYYEIIDVAASASQGEIEQALDAQYNNYRRLVTHHDPQVVNQATQALQLLELVRATLMDARKRAVYDAAIGVANGEKFAGLADPSARPAPDLPAKLPAAAPPPYGLLFAAQPLARPAAPPVPGVINSESQGWVCPKCKLANAVNSLFCKACGEKLASPCPACGSLVVRGAQFCSKCGVSIEQGQRKKEIDDLLAQLRASLTAVSRAEPEPEANVKDLGWLVVRDACWALVSLMVGLLSWLTMSGSLFGISLAGFLPSSNSDFGTQMAGALPVIAALALMGGMFILLSVVHKVFPLVTAIGAGFAMILFMTLPATFLGLLRLFGAPVIGSYIAGWAVTVLVFPVLISRIFAATKHSVELLKPFYQWIPDLGCLGIFFGLVFCVLPMLYGVYVILAAFEMESMLSMLMNKYEGLVMLVNGMLFSLSALLLALYTLLAWRTSLGVETRFKQAVSERAESITKLSEQIRSLEQSLASLNLRPRG